MTTSKTSAAHDDWILDTGPLVALLSKTDSAHAACVSALEAFHGHLITTEPVLTEAMHLVRRQPGAQEACLDFFLQGGAVLVELNVKRLASCKALVARYCDIPMDFADATLVSLTEELGIARVFTLDRRGFAAYRWRKTRRFEIVP
jgi:predicted nucleic acid-binding protein